VIAQHVTVYYDLGQFAAWPFNHGLWAFPNGETLVGFSRGSCRYERPEQLKHSAVDAAGGEYVTLRSTDGSSSWPLESLRSWGSRREIERMLLADDAPTAPTSPPDWTSPDFCLTAGLGIPPEAAPHVGYVQYSRDHGHGGSWDLGYPRVVRLGAGRVMVAYYFNRRDDPVQCEGGVRHIACTLIEP
jgi:hypothetical protein